jgi:alkylhydroperoxidase family enzyme
MPRIKLLDDAALPPETLAQVKALEAAGRDTALTRGLANAPTFFKNYFSFYLPARQGHSLDEALIELVRLKVARLNDCFTWLNARLLQVAEGETPKLTEAKISELDASSNSFTHEERLALEYAERLANDHHSMDDAFFDRMRTGFTDEQILELGMMIGQFIGFGRLLAALDLEPKVCDVPWRLFETLKIDSATEPTPMIFQLRQYDIHPGEMAAWVEVFETHIRPLHERLGMTIHGAWQALDTNTFIWLRSFETETAIAILEAAYFNSPERKALGDLPQQLIEKMTITRLTDYEPPSIAS